MLLRVGKYLIGAKIFFLCVSIFFLVSSLLHSNVEKQHGGTEKIFTIDREKDIDEQITSIDEYMQTVTGQALGLAVMNNGATTTLLPATSDYVVYRTYLYSITNGKRKSNIENPTSNGELNPHPTLSVGSSFTKEPSQVSMTYDLRISTISFLLALFL